MTGQSVKGKGRKEGWKVGLGEDIIMMQDKVEDPGRCFLFPQQGVDRVQRVRGQRVRVVGGPNIAAGAKRAGLGAGCWWVLGAGCLVLG